MSLIFPIDFFILSTFVTMLRKKVFSISISRLIPNRCCRQYRIKILSFFPLWITRGLSLINYPEVSNYLSFCYFVSNCIYNFIFQIKTGRKFIRKCQLTLHINYNNFNGENRQQQTFNKNVDKSYYRFLDITQCCHGRNEDVSMDNNYFVRL